MLLGERRSKKVIHQPLHSPKPTFFGKVFAIIVGLTMLVIIAEILSRNFMPHWKEFRSGSFMTSTPVPGHADVATGVPGYDDYFAQNNGDFRVRITINDFGLRNPDPITKADNRIWVVGDSMTFGWGVEQQQMYSSLIKNVSGQQAYNISSPGTSVCGYQALVDRMPKNLNPTAVIVGLILENDISRYDCTEFAREQKNTPKFAESISLLRLKRFLTLNCALYNFVSMSLKRIPLVERILVYSGLAAEPHMYRQQLKDDQLDIATTETVSELLKLKKQLPEGTPFAVLVAPARFEIKDANPFYQKLRDKMNTALSRENIPSIDPINGFLKKGFTATHFAHDGHWNALGHEIAATAVNKWLSNMSK